MASSNVEHEVIDLVAEERGLPREKVSLSARLSQDLGMDGDDAAEFFDSIHQKFGTDLTHLHEHWGEHFSPEGFSCWNGLVILPAVLIGGLIAGKAGLSIFWGMVITITLLVLWVWAMRKCGPPDRMVPITVADVVAAVEAGTWPERA